MSSGVQILRLSEVQIMHPGTVPGVQILRPCQMAAVQILRLTKRTLPRSDLPGVQILRPWKTTPL